MKKVILLVTIAVGAILLILMYYYEPPIEQQCVNEKIKDTNALYIGTFKTTTNSENLVTFNIVHINIIKNNHVVEKLSYSTDDPLMKPLGQDGRLCFIDLSKIVKKYTENFSISYWLQLHGNSIEVQTEYGPGVYLSSEVSITDCGIWGINVPTKMDEIVEVNHAFAYLNFVCETESE